MNETNPYGKVYLVGAGPGDPELLTMKAARLLGEADVILADRLANNTICQLYAKQALVIPVGKQCRKHKSTPQLTINQLMVHHAKLGRSVVRLKGGDVSIFSNVLDELETLEQHGIAYELVPGVTAALGAAAYAGMPLTARGKSTGVRLLTYYQHHAVQATDWQNLATTTDTLVFYMSGETCFELSDLLVKYGKPASTPIMLAEQATTPLQRLRTSTLGNCREQWEAADILSPALLIIGDVVELHQRFQWASTAQHAQPFFAPVHLIPQVPAAETLAEGQYQP